MIDLGAARFRVRRWRAENPEKAKMSARTAKAAQRGRAWSELDEAVCEANAWAGKAGRRGVAWIRPLEASLRRALDALERYREVY